MHKLSECCEKSVGDIVARMALSVEGDFAARLAQRRPDSTEACRHVEIMPVTLSAANGLARRTQRSFAALRMTARTPLK